MFEELMFLALCVSQFYRFPGWVFLTGLLPDAGLYPMILVMVVNYLIWLNKNLYNGSI